MNTPHPIFKNNILLFFLITLGFSINGFGQQPGSVDIIIEEGTELVGTNPTTCEGSIVQLRAVPDIPDPNYFYGWTKTDSNGTVQIPFSPENGGQGNGDPSTFVRLSISETTTFAVRVNGIDQVTPITIDVVPSSDAGISNTIFLCNKTGSIMLFDFLNGTPDIGGTWTSADGSAFSGEFDTGSDTPGVFTYTLTGTPPCIDVNASITVKACGEVDFDGDGVVNSLDLDDDNDGILDTEEASFCSGGVGLTETQFALEEDFGVGPPTQNAFVSNLLQFYIGAPQDDGSRNSTDGEYNVATSTHILNFNNQNAVFMATNLNGNVDADGNIDGRYLAINMKTSSFNPNDTPLQPIYQQTDLPVVQGTSNVLSMSIASLSDNTNETQPNLRIEIIDALTKLPLTPPVFRDTNPIPNGTDTWTKYDIPFTPPAGVVAVDVRVLNLQTNPGNGNDVGIDNIFLSTIECDFDRDAVANSADLDSDNDGIYDIVEAGRADLDTDGDGRVDGAVDLTPGSPTYGVPIAAGTGITPINSDTDSNADYLDIDSDNDGIIDNVEAQTTAGYTPPTGLDNDFDGVDDAYDTVTGTPFTLAPSTLADTNNDNIPDYLDLNSDILTNPDMTTSPGDCLTDTVEAYDLDQDGTADLIASGTDSDSDGLDDAFDTTVLQRITQDTNPTNGGQTPATFPDLHDPGNDRDWREEFSSGEDTPVEGDVCISGGNVNLFDLLPDGSNTNGTWTAPAGAPATSTDNLGTIDPSTATIGMISDYIYTSGPRITGCMRSTTLQVTFTAAPFAGTSTTITVGPADGIQNLVTILEGTSGMTLTPDGTWTPTAPATALTTDGQFDPANDDYGDYTYTVTTTGTCTETATVTILNCTPPAAPTSAGDQTVCSGTTPVPTLAVNPPLAGEEIRWFDAATEGTQLADMSVTFTPATLPTATTIYYAETYIPDNGCVSATRTPITLTIDTVTGNAGTDGTLNICARQTPVDLFDSLEGTPDAGGTWTDPANAPFGANDRGTFDPSIAGIAAGIYTYTIASNNSCPDQTATVTVNLTTTPIITVGAATCASDRLTFDQIFTTNGLWDVTLDPPTAGTVTNNSATGFTITGLLSAVSFDVTVTDPANTGCAVTLTVTGEDCSCPDQPEPTITNPDPICENDAIPELTATIPADLVGRWYDSNGVAIPGQDNTPTYTPTAADVTPGDNIFFVEAYNATENCASDQVQVTLTINQPPTIVIPADLDGCENDYSLPALTVGSYYTATGGPDGTGTNLPVGEQINTTQTLFIYAETPSTPGCFSEEEITITITPIPVVTPPEDEIACESYTLPALTNPNQSYLDEDDTVIPAGTVITSTQTIFVVENTNGCTSDPVSFTVEIVEDPIVNIGDDDFVCLAEDGTSLSTIPLTPSVILDTDLYSFNWTRDGTTVGTNDPFFDATEPGTYILEFSRTDLPDCTFESEPVTLEGIEALTEDDIILNDGDTISISDNTITVEVTKPGTYEYSLDNDFNYQSSNLFTKVPFGPHTVYVRNINGGCDPAFVDIQLFGFPKFFTPNGDSENQTWNVIDVNRDLPEMTINIFDRYGKLIKTISSENIGWDGTYNGRNMPAADYWFFAQLEDGRQFRSHFSLIR